MKRLVTVSVTICWILSLSLTAEAGFPRKPIELIVPFSAGGEADTISRVLASIMQEKSGKPVVVTNRPGQSGIVALQTLYNSRPDGYTIGHIYTNDILLRQVLSPQSVQFDIMKCSWLSQISSDPFLLSVQRNSIYHNLGALREAQVLSWGAENNENLRWSFSVIAAKKMGLHQRLVVGFRGTSLFSALQNKQFDILLANMNNTHEAKMVGNGDIKPILKFGPSEVAEIKNVPTAMQGSSAVILEREQAIIAPPGMPQERLEYLEGLIQKAISSSKFRQFLQDSKRSLTQGGAGKAIKSAEYYYRLFMDNKSLLQSSR